MPKLLKQKCHLKKLESQKNKVQKIFKIITEFDHESLSKIHKILTDITNDTREEEMFQSIHEMPEPEKAKALLLFNSMRNPKGKHTNKIISPYLQKKALDFIKDPKNQIKKLKAENIELKSANRRLIRR
ncbi:28280_t:CDS:2 [Dentiscutata erythropus]|uniref:28280_t:CDS:1 n=1 Tax=Dentiscutata erythropus TaxID=1348616 RepID=A0A9N9HC77_9GLOM|nr:28280_t:CDS:2 [Dentiscutata erythropus]